MCRKLTYTNFSYFMGDIPDSPLIVHDSPLIHYFSLFFTAPDAMMLSTPVASAQHAQHAQHAQLHRVRSTCSSGNRRRRWHRWHPVWMALATTKLLRCAGKKRQWVAPTISANLGGVDQSMFFFPVPMVKYLGSQIVWGFWAQSHMLRFVFLPVFQGWKGDFQTSEALVLTMS